MQTIEWREQFLYHETVVCCWGLNLPVILSESKHSEGNNGVGAFTADG